MKKITFDEYLEALEPKDPSKVKDKILDAADKDPDIDCLQFKQLYLKAYPDPF